MCSNYIKVAASSVINKIPSARNVFLCIDLDARPWDFQAEECALRACVDRFNNRRYVFETGENVEDDEYRPVDNDVLSVLGEKIELSTEFKQNYERWLDREVFSVSIDWDQLCTCKKEDME